MRIDSVIECKGGVDERREPLSDHPRRISLTTRFLSESMLSRDLHAGLMSSKLLPPHRSSSHADGTVS